MSTFPTTVPDETFRHVTGALAGSVINHVTEPVGATAKPNPVTVVVKVTGCPRDGFGEATTEIPGVCF